MSISTSIKKGKTYSSQNILGKNVSNSPDSHIKIYKNSDSLRKFIFAKAGLKVIDYVSQFLDFSDPHVLLLSTTSRFAIENIPDSNYTSVVDVKRLNDIRWLNKFFNTINSKMAMGAIFIGNFESKSTRKRRFLRKFPSPLNWIFYTVDFIFTRVAPKVKYVRHIYFSITKGKNRVITIAETLGRLVSCGFEIIDHREIDEKTWFVVKKVKEPDYNLNPSYGPIFKMPRIGKDGKIIHVYKFRTMHPYSEYLQDYILKLNGYSEIGKPANDFRLTTWGKFMRKYWLDELPQLLNVIKGEMRLVGIRPLSQRFLKEYPADVLELRKKQKPGCIPPYVALLKQEVHEYIESERIYLLEKQKHTHTTDIRYFFRAIYNILTNKIRSS